MLNFSNLDLKSVLFTIIALLIAIIPHEIAHGYAAYLLGDDTAKTDGRLSLNPINHIDPIGLISMIILRFGWAKAVPINPFKFKINRKIGTIIVSLAGVAANFILAFIFSILFVGAAINKNWLEPLFAEILWYNVMLGVFNLVPLPPLDGSKVIASLLPSKLEYMFYKYEKYLYIILVALLMTGVVNKIIAPIVLKVLNELVTIGINIWDIM
ncbi:site-2 protease family protein [Peptoniphilus mikwangii]|uniref:site-2 protease family protein n=1 Tax=Peptoniphilus mikwangii TaxID=1354300 RepID=UPI0003FF84FB|nr:site-2 protease family protein [Peptoniphilus mikwangii]